MDVSPAICLVHTSRFPCDGEVATGAFLLSFGFRGVIHGRREK